MDKLILRIGGFVLMVAAIPVTIYTGDGGCLLMGIFGACGAILSYQMGD